MASNKTKLEKIGNEYIESQYMDDIWGKYTGKVRDVYFANNYDYAVIDHTDRVSSYDSHICNVNNKGIILNYLNVWWMNQTKHIIDNHYLFHNKRFLMAKKCKRIDIEVVVRAYITGSTSTSLWTLYEQGKHNVYSLELPYGLKKHQKLPELVVTPTSKGEIDIPLTDRGIVEGDYLSEEEWKYVKSKALELFRYGTMVAASKGLILVDTKYEFGYDENGKIILIDELHTGDSSRFWAADSYQSRMDQGLDPICFDKDHIRRFISKADPQFKSTPLDKRVIPEIPNDVKNDLFLSYYSLYTNLTGESLDNVLNNDNNLSLQGFMNLYKDNVAPLAVILSGSLSDNPVVNIMCSELKENKVSFKYHFASAHKETEKVMNIIRHYNNFYGKRKIVFITIVGMSNALGGVLASNTKYPVVNCPNFKDQVDMMVNVHSSLQMPSKVPGAVILRKDNTAMFVRNILNL